MDQEGRLLDPMGLVLPWPWTSGPLLWLVFTHELTSSGGGVEQTLVQDDDTPTTMAMARAHVSATSANRRATPTSLVRWLALLGYDLVVPDRVQYVAALARQSAKRKLYHRRRKRAVWETMADAKLKQWAGMEAEFSMEETLKNYHGTEGPWEKTVRRAGLAKKGTARALERRRNADPKFAETWDRIENARKAAYEKIVHAIAKAVLAMQQALHLLLAKTETKRLEVTQKAEEAMQVGKENVNKITAENGVAVQIVGVAKRGKSKASTLYDTYGKQAVEGASGRVALLLAALAPYFTVFIAGINYLVSFAILVTKQLVSDVRVAMQST